MHLCGLFSRQLSHSPCNIHSSAPLSHDFLLDPTFSSLLLIHLSFPLPHPLYYSFPPQSLFTCFVVPFSPFLSLLQASVFFPPCSLSYPPSPHLVSLLHIPTVLPFFPFLPSLLASPELLLLRNFLVKYLSDVEWCSASGIDCKVEFAVKARHRPDNLSLYFRLSGAGEQLKLPNKKWEMLPFARKHIHTRFLCGTWTPRSLYLYFFLSSPISFPPSLPLWQPLAWVFGFVCVWVRTWLDCVKKAGTQGDADTHSNLRNTRAHTHAPPLWNTWSSDAIFAKHKLTRGACRA